jgi:hypothetical protein
VDISHGLGGSALGGKWTAWLRVCAGMFLALGFWTLYLAAGAPSASASTLNGSAILKNKGTPLDTGEYPSRQSFTVVLPPGASCTRHKAHDFTHVYSYLVPQGTNLSNVTFTSLPSVGLGLVDKSGRYFAERDAHSAPSGDTSRHHPGEIIGIPTNLEFAPLITDNYTRLTGTSGLLYTGTEPSASGVWEAGIACVNRAGTVTESWNTEVTFTYCSSDPNHFDWTSTPGSDSSDNGHWLPEIAWAAILPVAGIAVLGGSFWFRSRRKNQKVNLAVESIAS